MKTYDQLLLLLWQYGFSLSIMTTADCVYLSVRGVVDSNEIEIRRVLTHDGIIANSSAATQPLLQELNDMWDELRRTMKPRRKPGRAKVTRL